MDPLQWMGAVRIRIQTACKNIKIMHNYHNTNLSINSLWSEMLCVCKKQICHQDILTLTCCLWTQVHDNASSSEKVHPLLSSYIIIHHVLAFKCCFIHAFFYSDSDKQTFNGFFLLWIQDLYFSRKQRFEVKKNHLNLFIDLLQTCSLWITCITCGLLWHFYQLF